MFMMTFRKRGLHPETLATAVENSGTVTSPLIPWNSCGAYMSAALGVSTFVYFPYCFFNFLNPLLGLIYGFAGINVQRLAAGGPAAGGVAAPGADGRSRASRTSERRNHENCRCSGRKRPAQARRAHDARCAARQHPGCRAGPGAGRPAAPAGAGARQRPAGGSAGAAGVSLQRRGGLSRSTSWGRRPRA